MDAARAILGALMEKAEQTGERDHALLESLTTRYEEAHRKEMDAIDRWLAYVSRYLHEE